MSHTYTAIVLENTGFNAVNIPISKAVVRASATNEHICTGLALTQQKFLQSINVNLSWADVNEADYVLIYAETQGTTVNDAFCYFVTGVVMQAEDVATLSLVPDFLTTVGVANLELIDGITIRSTYALENIQPNKLASDDVYLTPSEPMELKSEWIGDSQNGYVYIDSTYDIVATAQSAEGVTYTDSATQETVTVPQPVYADPDKDVEFWLVDGNETSRIFKSIGVNGVVFNPPASAVSLRTPAEINDYIRQGIARLRSLGLETGILHQVFLPAYYVNQPVINERESAGVYYYQVANLTSTWHETQTAVSMAQDTDGSKEARVLNFSEFAVYGLMSASGDGIEVDPKDLMTQGNPYITSIADPRPDGNPYFRFKFIHNTSTDRKDFFRNCIKGLPWKNVPLVFTEATQNALTTARYHTTRNFAELGYKQQARGLAVNTFEFEKNLEMQRDFNYQNAAMGFGTGVMASALHMAGATESPNLGMVGGAQTASNALIAYSQQDRALALNEQVGGARLKNERTAMVENYSQQKLADMMEYGISLNYQAPTIMFPYNTETLRDFYGNGVFVYRLWYSNHDAERVKRIIRAYGAKYSMRIASAHFAIPTGKDFCYIEAQGVTVGHLPKWQADGLALQLNNGVRIWNTRPAHIA